MGLARDNARMVGKLVVVAAAHGSAGLLRARITTHPVRGQVSWAWHAKGDLLPPVPEGALLASDLSGLPEVFRAHWPAARTERFAA